MNKLVIAFFISTIVAGCASQPAVRVSDAQNVESVSAIAMSCKKPFALTQNCSALSGPTKKIEVSGQTMKVGGNTDGTITVMFGKGNANKSQASNLGYDLLKRELVTQGYEIVNVTPIESNGLMFGYAIETTQASYQIWDAFAVK